MADLEQVEGTEVVPKTDVEPLDETGAVASGEETVEEVEEEAVVPPGVEVPAAKSGVQKRLDELTRKRREAEIDAAYQRGRADAAETMRTNAASDRQDGRTVQKPAKISRENFETEEEFLAAVATDAVDRRFTVHEQKRELDAQAKVLKERRETQTAKLAEAGLIEKAEKVGAYASPAMLDAAGDQFLEVAGALVENPAESRRIGALPPLEQAAAIGEIRARLKMQPEKKTLTKAPKPSPSIGSGGSPPKKEFADMTREERFAFMDAKRLERLGLKPGKGK